MDAAADTCTRTHRSGQREQGRARRRTNRVRQPKQLLQPKQHALARCTRVCVLACSVATLTAATPTIYRHQTLALKRQRLAHTSSNNDNSSTSTTTAT